MRSRPFLAAAGAVVVMLTLCGFITAQGVRAEKQQLYFEKYQQPLEDHECLGHYLIKVDWLPLSPLLSFFPPSLRNVSSSSLLSCGLVSTGG